MNPSTLSQDNPNRRVSHPVPPPRISPAAPVCETTPAGKTSPAFCVAVSIDPSRQPPANLARRASGSTVTCRILDRSITRPPSQVLKPARLWPPQRTAVRIPASEAARTAFCTSLTSAQRAMRPGRAGYHAIPNATRVFVPAVAGTQQIPFESSAERRVNLFAGCGSSRVSLRMCRLTRPDVFLSIVASLAAQVQK